MSCTLSCLVAICMLCTYVIRSRLMHRGGAVTNVNSEIQTVLSPNPADLVEVVR